MGDQFVAEGPIVSPTEGLPVLSIQGLDVQFRGTQGSTHALRGVDVQMDPGEVLALVGESGSGKSTLGLAVQGLLEGSVEVTGSIRVGGVEVVGARPAVLRSLRRRSVRAVFQDPTTSLNPTKRVGKQLLEASVDDTAPEEWLRRVGIQHPAERLRAFPHQLSGGQRQRVMIAMAMAGHPSLVVADEPTTALDVTVQAQILELFRSLRQERGTAFLFITHDLAVASAIADRIVVLYAGKAVEVGPVRAIVSAPAHPYTAALLESRFDVSVDKSRTLPTLQGDPELARPEGQGCSFAPRCVLAVDRCRSEEPVLMPAANHLGMAACFRMEEVSATLWRRITGLWPDSPQGKAPEPVLELAGVWKSFAHRRFGSGHADKIAALRGVDLEVQDGECVAVVGESGSGKSTLLRLVAGLIEPDRGEVRYRGGDRPQMVYQDAYASLTPWLTVGDLVGERLRRMDLPRAERRARVATALGEVGLASATARVRPPALSGGQRQRVAIARAIVVPPRLLLCDEPVSAIDVSLAAAMLNLLQSLRLRLGMTMLFVTHDLAAARFVADRIVVMKEGEVVEVGGADDVTRHPEAEYTRQLLSAIPGRNAV